MSLLQNDNFYDGKGIHDCFSGDENPTISKSLALVQLPKADAPARTHDWIERKAPVPNINRTVSQMCEECVKVAKNALRDMKRRETLPKLAYRSLERSVSSFILWVDGHRVTEGQLDDALEKSRMLRRSMLKLLISISNTLSSIPLSVTHPRTQVLENLTLQAKVDFHNAGGDSGSEDSEESCGEDTKSNLSSSSGSIDWEEIAEEMRTDVECLMNLESLIESPFIEPRQVKNVNNSVTDLRPGTDYQSCFDRISHRFPGAQRELVNRLAKTHMYNDLRPWICHHIYCQHGTKPFNSREDWIQHLTSEHGLSENIESFICPLCLEDTGSGKMAVTKHLSSHLEETSLSALATNLESDGNPDANTGSFLQTKPSNEVRWFEPDSVHTFKGFTTTVEPTKESAGTRSSNSEDPTRNLEPIRRYTTSWDRLYSISDHQKIGEQNAMSFNQPEDSTPYGLPSEMGVPTLKESFVPTSSGSGYSCPVCLVFSGDVVSLREHLRCHPQTHLCKVEGCNRRFATSQDLTRHTTSAHADSLLTCQFCSAVIKGNRLDNLRRHIRTRHGAINNTLEP